MSYEMMEALLVQKIASLRESEGMFARALESNKDGPGRADLKSVHAQMTSQVSEVEQLLAAMNAAPGYEVDSIPALLPVDATPQIASSVWM